MVKADTPEDSSDDEARLVSFSELVGIDADQIAEASAAAHRLFEERNFEGARVIFRGLAAMDPADLDHLRMYAVVSTADRDYVGALEAIDTLLKQLEIAKAPAANTAELLAFKATVLIKAENKVEAHRYAEEALAIGAADAPWREALERSMTGLESALKLKLARKPHTDLSDVMAERIQEAVDEGRTLAWAFGYSDEEMLKLHADSIQLVRQGNLTSARRILEGLVSLDGTVPLFQTSLGTVCELLGDLAGAADAFDTAVNVSAGVPDADDLVASARLRRGIFHARFGQIEVARADLRAAIEAPSTPDEDRQEAEQTLARLDTEETDNPSVDGPDKGSGAEAQSASASPRGPPTS